ncbi:hypothetical protein LIX60_11960 [Streptomyces sp. S07_1.15]|uniref:hypothetical protein n=1 Tax=Streptomyces sp. S07_1.15 TaxID=2873925 RepID=UPI001D1429CF|nr:hypothetical protein [Streptomyces sp. S07_1.15]MCC3652171.1 hypothetical protein [Streptomyces sp. S07_1.15]
MSRSYGSGGRGGRWNHGSGSHGHPGSPVHTEAELRCPHGGRVAAASAAGSGAYAASAVRLDGLPLMTAADVHTVSGCGHTAGGRPSPCTSVRWSAGGGGRDAVTVDGAPVLLDTAASRGQCLSDALLPQGAPLVAGTGSETAQRGVECR